MVSRQGYNFAEMKFMAFFVHLMPLIYNATVSTMSGQWDVTIEGGR